MGGDTHFAFVCVQWVNAGGVLIMTSADCDGWRSTTDSWTWQFGISCTGGLGGNKTPTNSSHRLFDGIENSTTTVSSSDEYASSIEAQVRRAISKHIHPISPS